MPLILKDNMKSFEEKIEDSLSVVKAEAEVLDDLGQYLTRFK